MTNDEAKKRLEVWLKCVYCPEEKKCYDSHLHTTCEYTDYCDSVSIEEAIKVAIKDLEQEPCEDAISRQAAIEICNEEWDSDLMVERIEHLPPVNQFKPICCPSMGIDCENCPVYEKKSECEHDHEILKAYSDGASAVLDKIRAEIDAARFLDKDKKLFKNANASGLEEAMDIIDKYMAEGSDKE